MEPISIYIHIPMCVKKCAYCDFTSFCGRMKQREAFIEAVCREMREQAAPFSARGGWRRCFGGERPRADTARRSGACWIRSGCFALAADRGNQSDGGQPRYADAGKFAGKLPGGGR